MQFVYEAIGRSGRLIHGEAEAESAEALQDSLKSTGLALVSIRRSFSLFNRQPELKRKQLIDLFGYLKDLTAMGIAIGLLWKWVEESTGDVRTKEVVQSIQRSLDQGHTLADSLKETGAFPLLVLTNIQAGEVSGTLEKVFTAMEQHYKEEDELVSQVMKATMYPAITLGILFVNFSCLLAFVVPQLEPIFPKKLPLPTIILIFLSHGVRFWWWSVPLAVASIPFTWRRIPSRLKGWVWGQLYRVWVFGPLLKGLALCNFFFNLSLMLGAGIPLLEAFDIVLPLASSSLLAEKLRAAKVLMAQGGRFSDGLRDSFFPSVVASAMRQGESTGHLDVYTGRVAQFLRARARARLQTLATFLEPALLLAGGGMLLLLGAGIFLPIYGQMSHGGH